LKPAYLRSAAVAPFGVFPGRSLEDLVRPAIVAAVTGAGLTPGGIDAVVGGSYSSGVLTAQRAIRGLGLSARPVLNVENACASSASAAGYAAAMVRGGGARHVLVLGVEQLSRSLLRRGVAGGSSPLGQTQSASGQQISTSSSCTTRSRSPS
jgi:acetyl-CoA acetyltransferase